MKREGQAGLGAEGRREIGLRLRRILTCEWILTVTTFLPSFS